MGNKIQQKNERSLAERTVLVNSGLNPLGGLTPVALLITFLVWGGSVFAEPAITTGSEAAALKYYKAEEGLFHGLKLEKGVTPIDAVAKFLGYSISGQDLERLDPAVLMSPIVDSAGGGLGLGTNDSNGTRFRDGDILAARFFAPKIVNISASTPTPGWRKLIRLRSRPNSLATQSGVESAVILFNFVVAANEQPFTNRSFNTQVMLQAPSLRDRLYWLDFDGDQKLTTALNASFDAADLKHVGNHDYFVPDGCNACHGSPGNYRPPMVNYLDTDHWFDRINDDFVPLKDAGTPLVFDAKTNDSAQPSFAAAFDVIRRFNEEALRQNNLVHPDSFEAEAGRTWLKIHQTFDNHVPPVGRALSIGGSTPWKQEDAEGLGRLNRYCFRCHGSVYFSVYDRAKVVALAGDMKARIKPNSLQLKRAGFKMPPDRTLDPKEAQALYDFLETLK